MQFSFFFLFHLYSKELYSIKPLLLENFTFISYMQYLYKTIKLKVYDVLKGIYPILNNFSDKKEVLHIV